MLSRIAMVAAALCGLTGAANAQYDETRIRQWDQNTRVCAWGGWMDFTVSGFAGDRVQGPFVNATIGQIAANPGAYGVHQVVFHSGGQFSVRFSIPAKRAWNQQVLCVLRNGTLIDGDRIIVP